MYNAIHVVVGVEVGGLFRQRGDDNRLRPADVLVPCSHTGTDKAEALDITVVGPSLPNMLTRARSASVALNAAKKKHREKMTAHPRASTSAGFLAERPTPLLQVPPRL